MQFESRWWQLAAIQIGGAICLPIFVLGHALAANFGILSSLLAVGIGNFLLLILGIAGALYSVRTRLTTAEAASDTFGSYGKPYFAFILIISMMGWFAIQLDLMGLIGGKLLGINSTKPLNILLGVSITLLGLRGFRGMELLANICLPLLAITIGYAVFVAAQAPLQVAADEKIVFNGITFAVAAAIGAVIDMPTFFRMAKTSRDALYAAVLLFAGALPILEGIGIFLAAHGSSENLVDSLATDGSSMIWKAWVALFIILAGWTTNNTNLYSAAVSLSSVLKKRENYCQLFLGVIGTIVSLFNIQENLFGFLECIGILLAAAGGVMLFNQLSKGVSLKNYNIAGLIIGIISGSSNYFGIELSGSGFIDAFASAFAISVVGGLIANNNYKKEMKNYEVC